VLLASDPHGATEQLLVVAHGFDSDTIAGLVRSGLATATRETMKAGANLVEAVRLKITAAGREASGADDAAAARLLPSKGA